MAATKNDDAATAKRMTPDEMRRRFKKAKLTTIQAAALVGYHQTTIDSMLSGKKPIPYLLAYRVRQL